MAKVVRVSDDSGSNWYTLPGATGSLDRDSEAADDTIFGQTFKSEFPTLRTWSVSANAYFRGFAGYNTDIKQQGTAASMVAEATTNTTGLIYQITDANKRILDRSAAVVVDDNGSPVAASNIEWIDYLFGRVKFVSGYSVVGAITFDADYFPTTSLAKAQTFSLTQTAEYIDTTDFVSAQASGGFRSGDPGLRTVGLELGGVYDPSADFAGSIANEFIIEIDPKGDGSSICRGFFRLQNQNLDGDVGALEQENLTFTLNVPLIENPALWLPFGWQHSGSTELSTGLQKVLDAWQNETKLDVDYLPSGARGQSPLDGSTGDCVVTETSMTGGLSDVVTFDVTLQGDGAITTV